MSYEEKQNIAKEVMDLIIDKKVTLYDFRFILGEIEKLAGNLVLKKESEDS